MKSSSDSFLLKSGNSALELMPEGQPDRGAFQQFSDDKEQAPFKIQHVSNENAGDD